jgi:flagellar biosynthetic protein FliR
MVITTAEINGWIGQYLWPMLRIGAMVAAAPVFGTNFIPARIKIILVLLLCVVVAPVLPTVPSIDPLSGAGLLTALHQLLIGLAMGFAVHLVFGAFVLGAQVMSMGMALGFASMNDPATGVSVPTVGQFYTIMVTLAFLAINGHLIMIEVLVDSFRSMPIGPRGLQMNGLMDLVNWGSNMFAGALLIALPVITSLLVVNISFGIVVRAAPQLNIFAVGFPVIMILGFIIMYICLPGILGELTVLLDDIFLLMRHLVTGGG